MYYNINICLCHYFFILRTLLSFITAGLAAVDAVAVDAIPDIGENQQIVFTQWQGRSPPDSRRRCLA